MFCVITVSFRFLTVEAPLVWLGEGGSVTPVAARLCGGQVSPCPQTLQAFPFKAFSTGESGGRRLWKGYLWL